MATKKTTSSSKHLTTGEKVGIGVALTAAAAGALGAYFLTGSKHAAQNRKLVKSWMLKAKADILERIEEAKNMTAEEFSDLIDTVSAGYAAAQKVSRRDMSEFKDEMVAHWKKLEREAMKLRKAKAAQKTAKKA